MQKILLPIFITLIGLVACASPAPTPNPPRQEQNFAFTFEFGSCNNDILDTFNGTFTKDMIVEPDVTIPFQLSNSQLTIIFQKMSEISFFDYPDVFFIPTREGETVGIVTPAMQYRITVRNGDLTRSLSWLDEIIDPTTPKAENLRALFRLIMDMIQESPEYKNLPVPKAGCA